jgi:hypothetical protein
MRCNVLMITRSSAEGSGSNKLQTEPPWRGRSRTGQSDSARPFVPGARHEPPPVQAGREAKLWLPDKDLFAVEDSATLNRAIRLVVLARGTVRQFRWRGTIRRPALCLTMTIAPTSTQRSALHPLKVAALHSLLSRKSGQHRFTITARRKRHRRGCPQHAPTSSNAPLGE